jgi:hypothetical protein
LLLPGSGVQGLEGSSGTSNAPPIPRHLDPSKPVLRG